MIAANDSITDSNKVCDSTKLNNGSDYIDFVQLTAHPKYEISTSYPFIIRNISTGRILKQVITAQGYLTVKLGTTIPVHRVIAEQFITSNIQNMDVNHINHQRLDNRIENLEVITHSENLKKRKKLYTKQLSEYIPQDDINKDNLIQLERYKDKDFNKYFFDKSNDKLYIYQEKAKRYKVLKPTKNGLNYIVSLITSNKTILTSGYDKLINYCKTL